MGLADWFSTFCGNIKVKNGDSISCRYKAITKRLNADFRGTTSETANSLYVGSYGRNTAIHGTSDMDMIFVLPCSTYQHYNNYNGNGQSALLQAVRTSLQKTYSTTKIGADGQVIVITFDNGITFEIVPGFVNKGGSYTYPDSNGGGRWKTTNPKPEIEAIRTRNSECNNNLVPLCRMMRAWKAKMNVPIGGLLIDTLAYQFIGTWKYRDKSYFYYDYMCRDFFAFMANQDKAQEWWNAPGSGQRVHGPKGQFQCKATRGYNLAREAIKHEIADPKQEWSAKQKWREIFGTSFPS
ncbi:MAG: nucleotidyltransferase [Planctomycetota bacterium]|nr:MAG: nucleotidyltransferase [Planctomycetota bacterium]